MKQYILYTAVFWTVLPSLLHPRPARSFYDETGELYSLNLSGSVNAGVGLVRNPEQTSIYQDKEKTIWNGDFRFIADAAANRGFKAEMNVLQNIRSTPVLSLPGTRSGQLEVERSSLLFWEQQDTENSQAAVTVDTLNFSLGDAGSEFTVGRQPINLSVTFYYTPNDFFAPFAAQNFYRVYKPGVDAVRYEHSLADLAQLSLVGVLGYDADPDTGSGWSRSPDWQRSSAIGRYAKVWGNYEWGLLSGILAEYSVVGASVQGELFDWLGLRGEGNYRSSWKDSLSDGLALSIGLEHRFTGRLIVRFEQFHNGMGYDSIGEVNRAIADDVLQKGYLGRDYSAFDVNYEFTPLLTGDFLYLRNWTDSSHSFSVNSVYSVSDESELACTLTIPAGERPQGDGIHSEFGSLPIQVSIEYRHYF